MEEVDANANDEATARADIAKLLAAPYNFSWPQLIVMIHERIKDLSLVKVKPIPYEKGWQKIFSLNGGKRKNILWWQEMAQITKAIKNQVGAGEGKREKTLHEILKNRSHGLQEEIKYGYWVNQDTMIPKFFETSYKSKLPNIKFIPFQDWNEGWDAFADNKINVALRDFPTTVAYNSLLGVDSPLFFWPFFSFNGYGIFIKLSAIRKFCKDNAINKSSFKQLLPDERKQFLLQQCYIVEKNTDFEWVINNFCLNHGCDLQLIPDNVTYMNTKLAKREFVDNKKHTIYCTNPAHIIDLTRRKEFEFIPQNANINHKNFNGLICKEQYYNDNKPVIQRLIKTWFADIVPFKNEIKILAHPVSHRPEDYKPSYTVENLTTELSRETLSTITIDDLPVLYEHSNVFYEDPTFAFEEFYNKILTNKIAIQNYAEIALIQLDKRTNGIEKIKEVIAAIKENMIKL